MLFPALRSPRPEIAHHKRQVVTFCAASCRDTYRRMLVEEGLGTWDVIESPDPRPRNWFGTAYWRATCSTCGKGLEVAA